LHTSPGPFSIADSPGPNGGARRGTGPGLGGVGSGRVGSYNAAQWGRCFSPPPPRPCSLGRRGPIRGLRLGRGVGDRDEAALGVGLLLLCNLAVDQDLHAQRARAGLGLLVEVCGDKLEAVCV
jgi:hypothetical protein